MLLSRMRWLQVADFVRSPGVNQGATVLFAVLFAPVATSARLQNGRPRPRPGPGPCPLPRRRAALRGLLGSATVLQAQPG
jgi:hypothetical protein